MCGKSATYAPPVEAKSTVFSPAFKYAIKPVFAGKPAKDFVTLNHLKTFGWGASIEKATLFDTASEADAAIRYRNTEMLSTAPFLVVPVKVIETTEMVSTPVTTFVDTPVTTTTRELA